MGNKESRNEHYSRQTGHTLRGIHSDVVKRLGGLMPESLPGFQGIRTHEVDTQLIRRSMRRITDSGRR